MGQLEEKVRELRNKKGWEKQGAKPSRLARRELARLFKEAGIRDKRSDNRAG